MFENSAIKIATSKAISSSAPFIPGSMILLSGYVVWKLWKKQTQMQEATSELSKELKIVRKQVAGIKVSIEKEKETKKTGSEHVAALKKTGSERVAALSDSFKSFFNR